MKCHVWLGPTSTVHRIEGCCPPGCELDLANSYMTKTEGQHETETRAAKPCISILFKMLTSYDGI